MNLLFLASDKPLFTGLTERDYGGGALAAITTILLVFLILAVIILVTFSVGKIIEKVSKKAKTKTTEVKNEPVPVKNPLNLDDEDAVVAALVASIDFRNQIKKDVKVVSIKEIK